MSKAAKSAGAINATGVDLPFEEALGKLESIVESMETDDLPLEALLACFEEGTRLSQICQAKLAQAELRIQQLEKDAAGALAARSLPISEAAANE